MSDLRSIVDRELARVELRPFTLEGFHRRRDRKRRNQRITAAVLALAIAVVAVDGLMRAFRAEQHHIPVGPTITPENASRLKLAWQTDRSTVRLGRVLTVSPGVVFAIGGTGDHDDTLYAYPIDCGRAGATCEPMWTFQLPPRPDGGSSDIRYAMVSGGTDRILYLVGADTLFALPASCGSGGATCEPRWSAHIGPGGGGIQVEGDIVYLNSVDRRIVAFPTRCSTPCQPIWEKTGWLSLVVGDGVAYEGTGGDNASVTAYPMSCYGNDGCVPLWAWTPRSLAPHLEVRAVVGDVYVWTDPGPSPLGEIEALPTSCRSTCEPVWRSDRPYLLGAEDGTAYVGGFCSRACHPAVGVVSAYPSSCSRSPCEPVWTATSPNVLTTDRGNGFDPVAIAQGVVYVGDHNDPRGTLHAFTGGCLGVDACSAHVVATRSRTVDSLIAKDGVVYVGYGLWTERSIGGVAAYSGSCLAHHDNCHTLWSWTPGAGLSSTVSAVAEGRVLVISSDGTLSAFAV